MRGVRQARDLSDQSGQLEKRPHRVPPLAGSDLSPPRSPNSPSKAPLSLKANSVVGNPVSLLRRKQSRPEQEQDSVVVNQNKNQPSRPQTARLGVRGSAFFRDSPPERPSSAGTAQQQDGSEGVRQLDLKLPDDELPMTGTGYLLGPPPGNTSPVGSQDNGVYEDSLTGSFGNN